MRGGREGRVCPDDLDHMIMGSVRLELSRLERIDIACDVATRGARS